MNNSGISYNTYPCGCQLPGPTLTLEIGSDAVRTVADDLKRRAGKGKPFRPETWVKVAHGLEIATQHYYEPGGSAGRLSYDTQEDVWIIAYNVARRLISQAAALVHELAHYYWREASGLWLCGHPVVYYYEGPVEDEWHRLARDVERLIVPQMRYQAPPEGLFIAEGT